MSTSTPESQKLYRKVADAVVDAIRAGQFKAGQRLPSERELCDQYGVSRPTVREALIALEIGGWVEIRHGSGIYILDRESESDEQRPELDVGPFDLMEARRLFEGEVAAIAAATITDEELDELEALVPQMDEGRQGLEAAEQADRSFHLKIAEASRNGAMLGVVTDLWDRRYRSPLCRVLLQRAKEAGVNPRVSDHDDILRALRARDPRKARDAMRQHLANVMEALLVATEVEELERTRAALDEIRNRARKRINL